MMCNRVDTAFNSSASGVIPNSGQHADPEDAKVLACAAAKATLIVPGDGHLLDLKEYKTLKIIPVNELLVQFK